MTSRILARYLLLFCFAFFCIGHCSGRLAHADTKAKRLLFDDCGETRSALTRLTAEEVDGFVAYLGRVLTLPTGSEPELLREPELMDLIPPSPLHGPTDPTIEGLKSLNISRTLEPAREIEAKKCAAELLLEFDERGVRELPYLLQAAVDTGLPDEARSHFIVTARRLIELAVRGKSSVLADLAPKLIDLELLHPKLGIADLLLGMKDISYPLLFGELFGERENRAVLANSILRKFKESQDQFRAEFQKRFSAASTNSKARVLEFLIDWPDLPSEILDDVLEAALGGEPRTEAKAIWLSTKILEQSEKEGPFISSHDVLGQFYGLIVEVQVYEVTRLVEPLLPGMFRKLDSAYELLIRVLSRSLRDASLRDEFKSQVLLLPLANRILFLPLLPFDDAGVIPICTESIRSTFAPVRDAAFDCLGETPLLVEEKVRAMLQLQKSPALKRDPSQRQIVGLLVIDAVSRLLKQSGEKAVSLKSFLPLVLELIAEPPLPPRKRIAKGSGIVTLRPAEGWQSILRQSPLALQTAVNRLSDAKNPARIAAFVDFLTGLESLEPRTKESYLKRFPK